MNQSTLTPPSLPTATPAAFRLTRPEIDRFHFEGYLGPYAAYSPEAMGRINAELHDRVFKTPGPNPKSTTHSRQLDTPLVYGMVANPAVVGRICSLLGEDLMAWTSGFWLKEPNGKGLETPWHQDINYWPLEPQVTITCWMATVDVNAENAPLQIIPGSHRHMVPHLDVAGRALEQQADPKYIDRSKVKTLIMKAGEFVIFSEKMLHGSPANVSPRPRYALSTRYSLPQTRLFPNEAPIDFPAYRSLMVSGTDKFGFNPFGTPPVG